jgi:protein ImuB
MLWAALLLPQLALDAVTRDGHDPAEALVLIDGPLQRRHVHAASAAAQAAGIRPGHSLAAAQALLPGLHSAPVDHAAMHTLRNSIASIGYAVSEQVSLREPDAVLVEIGASLRCFGGWPRIARILRARLRTLGVTHRLGVAVTPLAAVLAAADRDGHIVDTDAHEDDAARSAAAQRPPASHAGDCA